jgi:hypothetical protein
MNDRDEITKPVGDELTAEQDTPLPEEKPDPITPNLVYETHTDDDHLHDRDHDEDEHHVSLAARSLQILVILVVGGALALWAGPRLAPNLPSGMGSIAQWLTPGASLAEDQVAALRAEISATQSAPAAQLDQAAIDELVANSSTTTELRDALAALAQRVDAAEQTPAVMSTRIDSLETRFAGVEAMLTTIDTELRDLVTAGLALDSQAAADIAGYAATIEGLRAQIAAMDARLVDQAARIDTVTAEIQTEAQSAVESAAAAQAMSELQATLITLEAALGNGLPYRAEIDWIASSQNQEIPAPLAEHADTGITRMVHLRDTFPALAHDAIRTDLRAETGDTALGQFGAFLQAQVASRSLTPQEGTSTDAILSRAEDALRQGDLDLALRHMRTLSVVAREIYADWLALAQARQAALSGFEALKAALSEAAQ